MRREARTQDKRPNLDEETWTGHAARHVGHRLRPLGEQEYYCFTCHEQFSVATVWAHMEPPSQDKLRHP